MKSSTAKHYSTLVGIALLQIVYLIKECFEDYKRKAYDNAENQKQYEVFNAEKKQFEYTQSENIRVGDILRLKNGDIVPSDVLILQSSHDDGNVYITTSAVDGESGVKCFKSMAIIDPKKDPNEELTEKVMNSQCLRSPASNRISDVKIYFKRQHIPHNKLAFRGFQILHTDTMLGLVVYTGKDTSMMQNVNGIQNKLSKLDERVNRITYLMILITFLLTLATSIPVYFYKKNSPYRRDFSFVTQALGYLVIYASLSPLSIYSYVVVFEFIMMMQVQIDKAHKSRVKVNNEQVLPDLGNVDIIFTDKTGTLTKNLMQLQEVILQIPTHTSKARVHSIDDLKIKENHNAVVVQFFQNLLVCNSSNLNPEFDNKLQQLDENNLSDYYLSTNQDDESLLVGALKCGYRMTSKNDEFQCNDMRGTQVKYQMCPRQSIEFNHDRKYQIVVVKDTAAAGGDKYRAFAKGAYEKLKPMIKPKSIPDNTEELINSFYRKCFRVLCFATATFDHLPSEEELTEAKARYEFTALSGTEDRLADGVQWTIESLMQAKIKFVMLTGDNPVTANNIAQSCKLVDKDLDKCALEPSNFHMYARPDSTMDFSDLRPMQYNEYAIFDANMTHQVIANPDAFIKWSKHSKCLIFSRSTPDMKASIVRIYKRTRNENIHVKDTNNVLTIGDGSNDVAMLREANLSVGIRGKEGLIASSSADISVDRFSRLKRLLLVHGAWDYFRASLGILVFTYKNIASFMPFVLFIAFSDFSIVKIFDDWINISLVFLFTSFSLLPVSAFDFQVNEANRMAYPILYRASSSRKNYSNISMCEWVQNSILHGTVPFLLVYFAAKTFPFLTHSGKLPSFQYVSNLTLLSTLIVIIAKTQLIAHHLSLINCTMTCSAFLFYGLFIIIPIFNDQIDLGLKRELFGSYQTYMLIMIIVVITLLRDLLWVWCKRTIYWEQTDLIHNNERGIHGRFEAVPYKKVKQQLVRITGNSRQ